MARDNCCIGAELMSLARIRAALVERTHLERLRQFLYVYC